MGRGRKEGVKEKVGEDEERERVREEECQDGKTLWLVSRKGKKEEVKRRKWKNSKHKRLRREES